MTNGRFRANPNYVTYVDLLLQLHALIQEGKVDDAEADAVRDEMDAPWYGMDSDEIARIRGISSDLYTLGQADSPIKHSNQPDTLAPSLGKLLRERVALADWDGVLKLVREMSSQISWDRAAPIRGDAYSRLGEHSTAARFFSAAVALNPANDHLKLRWGEELHRIGQEDESRRALDELWRKGDMLSPDVAIWMGFSRINDILTQTPADPGYVQETIRVLSKARLRLSKDPVEQDLFAAASLVGEALCCHGLNDDVRAIEVLTNAISCGWDGAELRTIRGLLHFNDNLDASMKDFEIAIQYGVRDAWPFYYLAGNALRSGDLDACVQYCNGGIRTAADVDVIAELFEWKAAAMLRSGQVHAANQLLTQAAELSPYRIQSKVSAEGDNAIASDENESTTAVTQRQPDDLMLLQVARRLQPPLAA